MREYVGTVKKVSNETFTLAYDSRSAEKQLAAKLVATTPRQKITVGARVKIVGDWVGKLGAGALTTFTVQNIEFLG